MSLYRVTYYPGIMVTLALKVTSRVISPQKDNICKLFEKINKSGFHAKGVVIPSNLCQQYNLIIYAWIIDANSVSF